VAGDTRPYHHGDLRAALIEAGLQLARQKGVSALGMRELTRAVGVTPNAAYRHFANLRAFVLTVALEAQHRLAHTILDRMQVIPIDANPAVRAVERLRAFGLGYIHFALADPGWFELACVSQEEPPDTGPHGGAKTTVPPPHQLLLGALDEMDQAGALPPHRRANAEWACWATVHGFANLATSGPLRGMDRDALNRLAEQAMDTLINGLTA
jgi:AcrR family transcriptional regulator